MGPFEPGLLHRIEAPRRVVVVRASRIGDFICATPASRALRAAVPHAEVSLIALPMVRELAERSPHIDHFIPFPGFPGMAEQFFDARRATEFFREMQSRQFDLAIQMHGSGANSNPFTLLLGATHTAGYIKPGGDPGRLDAALPIPEGHEVDRALALVEFLGAPAQGTYLEYPLTLDERAEASTLLGAAPRPLIGIHASAREATKRWFGDRFIETARELQRLTGGTIVILGEEPLSGDYPPGTRNLAGRTSLGKLGAVSRQLDVLITNDSGPAHVAYALGTPTVTIFGGTDPEVWKARDSVSRRVLAYPVSCRPCDYAVCPIGYVCLDGISVDQVVAAAREILAEPRQATSASEVGSPAPTTQR